MIHYKDRTFCSAGVLCRDNYKCERILWQSDIVAAREAGLPICFMDFTTAECFVPFFIVGDAPRRQKRQGKSKSISVKSKGKIARKYVKRTRTGNKSTCLVKTKKRSV